MLLTTSSAELLAADFLTRGLCIQLRSAVSQVQQLLCSLVRNRDLNWDEITEVTCEVPLKLGFFLS